MEISNWATGGVMALYGAMSGGVIAWHSGRYSTAQAMGWLRENRYALNPFYLTQQIHQLDQQRSNTQQAQAKRIKSYAGLTAVVFALLGLLAPSVTQAALQALVFSILIWLAAVDIDQQSVPEKGLGILAVGLLAVHVLMPSLRWAASDSILMGMLVVVMVIGLSVGVVRIMGAVPAADPVFGEGDVIALVVLTLGYGVDVVTAFAVAGALSVLAYGLGSLYKRCLHGMGHHPKQSESTSGHHYMAFFPFIVLGMATMVCLAWTHLFQLSSYWNDVYRWWFLN